MSRLLCFITAICVSALAPAQTINTCVDAKGKVTLTESGCAKLGLRNKSTNYYQPSSHEDLEIARRERQITLEKGRALDERISQQPPALRAATTIGVTSPKTATSQKQLECTSIDNEIAAIKVQQRSYSYPYLTERKRKLEDLRFEKQCHHSD